MNGSAERGQATVELVVLLPVVVLVLAAVAQVAMLARDQLLVVHASWEAARAAAVEPTLAGAERAAQQATGLDASRFQVTIGPERRTGERLPVAVTYRDPTDVLLVGPLLGDVSLRSTVTVRIE